MTQPAKLATNEVERLARLKSLLLLDTAPEPLFNEIVKLASEVCEAPIALISLVDENRQWFKANVGLEAATETPRDIAFCSHAILDDRLFEITDTQNDSRFKNNPLVTSAPNIRFYAGMPIAMPDGLNIGTLCVIDTTPKTLNVYQEKILEGLSRLATRALLQREQDIIALHSESAILSTVVAQSNDAILTMTFDGFVTSWNIGAERMYGYESKEIIGRHISIIYPKDRLHEDKLLLERIKNNEPTEHFETIRLNKKHLEIDVSISASPIKDVNGKIIGVSKIIRDISEKKRLQQKLADEHELLRVTMDSIGDAVITTDTQGNIQYLNPVAELLTGWSQKDATGLPLFTVFNIINEKTRLPCLNPIEICLSEHRVIGLAHDTVLINRYGKEYGIEDSASPIRGSKNELLGVVLVFHDVSEQRAMANEISYRASHDHLTGLINRGEFENILNKCLQKHRVPVVDDGLMFIDLDQFKLINDTCGHAAGDIVLKEIVNIIKQSIRTSDAFARMGGDEFAILLENCSIDKAYEIANNICRAVDAYRFNYNDKRFRVGASIGLIVLDGSNTKLTDVMLTADRACYQAKNAGKNRVHLDHNTQRSTQEHINKTLWVSRIQDAIDENHFRLYCQRITPINGVGLELAEILIRYVDTSGQVIAPSSFIPTAERFNMMGTIDKWVIKKAFSWIQENADHLHHIDHISINISGQSVSDHEFTKFIECTINEMEFTHCHKVCFEITETFTITNYDNSLTFFQKVKQHGFSLALDDFGSGASSFGYLKHIPADYLKIDGLFVKDLLNDKISQATIKCITEVAAVTNKKTIAEWVECDAVRAMLQSMGVDFIQGYVHHKPSPIDLLLENNLPYPILKSAGTKIHLLA